jgi:hypothetical protein
MVQVHALRRLPSHLLTYTTHTPSALASRALVADAAHRRLWTAIHKLFGYSSVFLAMINIFLGLNQIQAVSEVKGVALTPCLLPPCLLGLQLVPLPPLSTPPRRPRP